jgi:hypothetical protein
VNRTVLLGIAFVLIVIGVLVYSSLNVAKARVEVCVDFNGRTQCRTASGDTKEHAFHTAQSNACALLASGVTEVMACERSNPASVRYLNLK